MKNVILSLAILVATSISAFASSDNNTQASSDKAKTECRSKGVCPAGKEKSKKCDRFFEGIELTADQKTKLAELRKEYSAGNKSSECNAVCKDCKDCKDCRNCKDCKDCKACKNPQECKNKKDCKKENLTAEQKKQLKAESKARKTEARKKYLEGVKSVLTPDQYTRFLENNFLYKGDVKGHGKMRGYKMHRQHDKMHHKHDGKKMSRRGYSKMKSGNPV